NLYTGTEMFATAWKCMKRYKNSCVVLYR
ncbi:MAG: hypothetical protein K0R54_6122, partial [Clostridiaceae bacterium]|nr:hypothetical protein [Clostridiaceae bacterium]